MFGLCLRLPGAGQRGGPSPGRWWGGWWGRTGPLGWCSVASRCTVGPPARQCTRNTNHNWPFWTGREGKGERETERGNFELWATKSTPVATKEAVSSCEWSSSLREVGRCVNCPVHDLHVHVRIRHCGGSAYIHGAEDELVILTG